MLDQILDYADPYIAEFLIGLIGTRLVWVYTYVARTKQSQESLHSAIHTGVDLITDALARTVPGANTPVPDVLVQEVVEYTMQSVPDAVKFLKAKRRSIELLARAKINMRLPHILSDAIAKL